MNVRTTFDFSPYVRGPRISATSGVVLTIRLLRAAAQQKPLAPHVFEALVAMRNAGEEVRRILEVRRSNKPRDLRELDRNHDGSWAGLHMRVDAHTRVRGDTAGAAAQLLEQLFPQGLNFLKNGYDEQWVHSDTLLATINKDELLRAQLSELAGAYFVDAVEQAHAAMTQALGFDEGGAEEPEPIPELGTAVQVLAAAIGSYGRAFAGMVKLGDPESLARFEAAMAPRTQHLARQSKASRASAGLELGDDELDAAEAEEASILGELDAPLPEPEG